MLPYFCHGSDNYYVRVPVNVSIVTGKKHLTISDAVDTIYSTATATTLCQPLNIKPRCIHWLCLSASSRPIPARTQWPLPASAACKSATVTINVIGSSGEASRPRER